MKILRRWPLFTVVLFLSFILGLLAIFYYKSETEEINEERQDYLHAVNNLKIDQIVGWRKEMLSTANFFPTIDKFIKYTAGLSKNRTNPEAEKYFRKALLPYKLNHHYENIFITNTSGALLYSLDPDYKTVDERTIINIKSAIELDSVYFGDFYFSNEDSAVCFDLISPVKDNNGIMTGAIIQRVNPVYRFFPLVQKWPTKSKTAETLLFRKEKDKVVFLTELRHINNSALSFSVSLKDTEVIAVKGALGRRGIIEGIDYRGEDVLADLNVVPGTNWYIISKVDKDELYTDLIFRGETILIIVIISILSIIFGTLYLYKSKQSRIYKDLFLKEKKILEIQEEFRTTLYSIGDAVITTDNSGRIKQMNMEAEKLTGWKESEAQGKMLVEVFKILNEDTRREVENPFQKVMRKGALVSLANHTLLISKQGKEIPIADSGSPIKDNNGNIIGVVLVFRDQTEEREVQKDLAEREHRFATLVSNLPGFVYRCLNDHSWTMLFISEGCYEITGYQPDDFIENKKLSFNDVILPDYREPIWEKWQQVLKEKKYFEFEYPIKNKNGEIRWIWERGRGIFSEDGVLQYLEGFITDITEQINAEKALKESELLFRTLTENSPVGIFRTDANGSTIYVNPYWCEISKLSFEEALGDGWFKAVHPEDRILLSEGWRNATINNQSSKVEYRFTQPDGTIKWVAGLAVPLKNEDGTLNGYIGTITDITESKLAEVELKASEARLNESQKVARLGHYEFNVLTGIWTSSVMLDELFGIDSSYKHDLTGWNELLHPDDRERMLEHLQNHVIKQKNKFDSEYRLIRYSDKKVIWVKGIGNLEFDTNANPIKMFGTIQDITEIRRVENEIRMFKFVIDNAQDAIFWMNSDGGFIYVNDQACNSLGYSREELLKLKLFDIDPIFPEEKWKKNWEDLKLNNVKVQKTESYHKRKDGTVFPIDVTAKHFKLGNTEVRVAFIRDITQRRNADETLKKLSQAVEQSNVSIIITDRAGKIEYVNPKLCSVTGYSAKEIYGMNPRILNSGMQPKEFYKEMWDTLLSGKSWQGEMNNKKKNGELFWEMVMISPITNESGLITHFVAVKEDITDKKNLLEDLIFAKEKAEEMNRIKTFFFANMSHELRTPFVGIIGFAELLEETLTDPEEKEFASQILKSSRRLTQTLNKILDISRLESAKPDLNLTDVDINELVTETGELFVQFAKVNNTVININAGFINRKIKTDRKILGEILNNLVNNAVKFTRNGVIEISSKKIILGKKDFLEIQVSDNGIGIAKEKQSVIWQEFRQASEGYNRSFEGTGLGLTITKKYVEILNGKIHLESEEGKGSTFIIELPVIYSEPEKIEVKSESNNIINLPEEPIVMRKKLLVVEDDGVAIHFVKTVLNHKFEIETAFNALAALELVSKNKYDAFLLDINLGRGMDGIELMNEIKKIKGNENVPYVALTAYASESDKQEFLSKGFTHYISKPFLSGELKELLKEIFSE